MLTFLHNSSNTDCRLADWCKGYFRFNHSCPKIVLVSDFFHKYEFCQIAKLMILCMQRKCLPCYAINKFLEMHKPIVKWLLDVEYILV